MALTAEDDPPPGQATQAEIIRAHILLQYILPARQRGEKSIVIRAGDVVGQLKIPDSAPNVCQALASQKLQALGHVILEGQHGPPQSTTTTFTFSLEDVPDFGVARAELILRSVFGAPDIDSDKMVSFMTSDGRALALQRDIARVQLWFEHGPDIGAPPTQHRTYAPSEGRHSNLPPRLKYDPPQSLISAGFPHPVVSARAIDEGQLSRLLTWYKNPGMLDRAALALMKTQFLERYPDFPPNFFTAESGSYFDEERSYKDRLLAAARSVISQAPPIAEQELGARLIDLLTGPKSGLLGWRTDGRLKKLRATVPGTFEEAAGRLARSDAPVAEAVGAFVAETWPSLAVGQEGKLPYSESRNIPSMLAAFIHPISAFGINTTPLSNASQALLGKSILSNNPLTSAEYAQVIEFATTIFSIMTSEWGWKPRDLWDVQGFLWAISRSDDSNADDSVDQQTPERRLPVPPTNLILYGPPGTGKTYSTALEAVRLCDGSASADRQELMKRYEELMEAGQIGFVTFHQSYAYEDFVEGLRPTTGPIDSDEIEKASSGGFRLEPRKGIFREISALAEQARKSTGGGGFDLAGRKLFKMSLGRASDDDQIYDRAIEGGYVVLGYGGDVDWSDPKFDDWSAIFQRWNEAEPGTSGNHGDIAQTWTLRAGMQVGDLVIVSAGLHNFKAVGEITGPYFFDPTGVRTYNHRRSVRWLLVLDEPLPVDTIYETTFAPTSCYQLNTSRIKNEALSRLLPGGSTPGDASPSQFVLIIDEINRANISKVFGELITLIEPDKRLGQANALRVKLPYSGDSFGVPENLHLIGTMNTADRSIALLDTALRRRFRFQELMPREDLLSIDVEGINVQQLLRSLNDRIEYLFDREHQIGHAYFLGCNSKAGLDTVIRTKVIPLLAEYFYENWERVRQVLGEKSDEGGFIVRQKLIAPPGSDGDFANERFRYSVRENFELAAYQQLDA